MICPPPSRLVLVVNTLLNLALWGLLVVILGSWLFDCGRIAVALQ